MASSIEARVSIVYPGTKKAHKLRLPKYHLGTDHPKEIPKAPTIVDRITCQRTPIAFYQDTPRQMSVNRGPEP